MLILTRKKLQSIIIGDDISIHILGIKGNIVRIGIEAPKNTSVHRQEIYIKIMNDSKSIPHKPQRGISNGAYRTTVETV